MVKTMTQGGTSLNTQAVAGKTEKSAPRFRFRALSLGKLAGRALDAVLPPQCPVCNAIVDSAGVLCGTCWQKVDFLGTPACSACGRPFEFDLGDGALCAVCVRQRPPFERARAVMAYGDISRRMILAFKHGDRTDAAPGLGKWLVRAGRDLIADADIIAPVPLHWTRLFRRRYNQAALLAHGVGREAGIEVVADLIQRRRRTPPQGRMGPAQRRRNLKGAFRVHPARAAGLKGQRVLLIDDVLTTGATASACSRVLLRGGAGAVDVLTLARVVRAERE